jgi:hypothetical protein
VHKNEEEEFKEKKNKRRKRGEAKKKLTVVPSMLAMEFATFKNIFLETTYCLIILRRIWWTK